MITFSLRIRLGKIKPSQPRETGCTTSNSFAPFATVPGLRMSLSCSTLCIIGLALDPRELKIQPASLSGNFRFALSPPYTTLGDVSAVHIQAIIRIDFHREPVVEDSTN